MAPRRRHRPGTKKSAKATSKIFVIDHLAHRGDGVAHSDTGPVYVAGTLPGERVEVDVIGERGQLTHVLEPSSRRVIPVCDHFEQCGGCGLQHLDPSAYLDWKHEQVRSALDQHNIHTQIEPILAIEAHSRRRATFTAERQKEGLAFGFMAGRGKRVIDIKACTILTPDLEKALPKLKQLVHLIMPKRGRVQVKIHVLSSETGLDVKLDDFGDWPDFQTERALMDFAIEKGFARLSLGEDVLIEREKPVLTFGTAKVTPAPGGFAQAVQKSEKALQSEVFKALAGRKFVLDLFSGAGTLSLPLASQARVHAIENEGRALEALEKAAKTTSGLKPVTVEKRDLFRRPLTVKELNRYDAIVLDPPRVGACEQIPAIVESAHDLVVYVSCSPISFARDAAILIQGGFHLSRLRPVDQFLFSHHIELVGVFKRN